MILCIEQPEKTRSMQLILIKSRLQNGYKVVPTAAIYTLVRAHTHIYIYILNLHFHPSMYIILFTAILNFK